METTTIADTPLTKQQIVRAEQSKAIVNLKRDYIKMGYSVYAILRHVSKSRMSRWIDLYTINAERIPQRITYYAAKALAAHYDQRHEALRVNGVNSDAAQDAVNDLAWYLFGNSDSLTCKLL